MLKKVFSADFKLLIRPILTLVLILIALSVGACSCQLVCLLTPVGQSPAAFGLIAIYNLSTIGVFVCLVVAAAFVLIRFYKSVFTNEGYLTMVLPVGTHTMLLGKMLAGLVLGLIVFVGYRLAQFFLFDIPTAATMIRNGLSDEFFRALMDSMRASMDFSFDSLVRAVCQVCVALVNFLFAYTAIVFGCTFFRRAKVIACLLFLFAFEVFWNIVTTLFNLLVYMQDWNQMVGYVLLISMAVVFCVAAYESSWTLMHKHFNIE